MLTQKDKFLMEVAIELIEDMLKVAIDKDNHVVASMLGAVVDGLKDIKDR